MSLNYLPKCAIVAALSLLLGACSSGSSQPNDSAQSNGGETPNTGQNGEPAGENPWPWTFPGGELRDLADQLPFSKDDCVAAGSSLDPGGAETVCDNLFSIPADRNGLAGDGFVASTHFPDGTVFEHGLFVAPDEQGIIHVDTSAWYDSNGDGFYEPYTGTLTFVFQNIGFEDEQGFPFSDISSFEGSPDPEQAGVFRAQVDASQLAVLAEGLPVDNGFEIFVFTPEAANNSSRLLTLKNVLIDSGDQRAIGLADEVETWDLIGPFTPVIVTQF